VRGAQEIAAGNLDRRISVQGQDEVGRLGEAFNRMGIP
jgi:HAMP domain-containing protein